jgi:hypothetical protein
MSLAAAPGPLILVLIADPGGGEFPEAVSAERTPERQYFDDGSIMAQSISGKSWFELR